MPSTSSVAPITMAASPASTTPSSLPTRRPPAGPLSAAARSSAEGDGGGTAQRRCDRGRQLLGLSSGKKERKREGADTKTCRGAGKVLREALYPQTMAATPATAIATETTASSTSRLPGQRGIRARCADGCPTSRRRAKYDAGDDRRGIAATGRRAFRRPRHPRVVNDDGWLTPAAVNEMCGHARRAAERDRRDTPWLPNRPRRPGHRRVAVTRSTSRISEPSVFSSTCYSRALVEAFAAAPPGSPVGYVGEWHSHPAAVEPSPVDLSAIADIAGATDDAVILVVLSRDNDEWRLNVSEVRASTVPPSDPTAGYHSTRTSLPAAAAGA